MNPQNGLKVGTLKYYPIIIILMWHVAAVFEENTFWLCHFHGMSMSIMMPYIFSTCLVLAQITSISRDSVVACPREDKPCWTGSMPGWVTVQQYWFLYCHWQNIYLILMSRQWQNRNRTHLINPWLMLLTVVLEHNYWGFTYEVF